MKKSENKLAPAYVVSTDWHAKENNRDLLDLISQQCDLADELGVKTLICLGDMFTSRIGQKVDTLNLMSEIFNLIHERGKEIWCIPGNHDKQNYDSADSFLDPYKHFPGVKVINMSGGLPLPNKRGMIYLLPYFKESIWKTKVSDLIDYIGDYEGIKVLMSHQAVNGSRNNDGTEVSCGIGSSDLMFFDYVYLGHYHDYQQPLPNTYHLPSIKQHNFGENQNKGFTIIYEDGSFDIVNSRFKPFIKHKLDLNDISVKDAVKLIKNSLNPDANIRYELTGSKDLLKSFPKEEVEAWGVSITTKDVDIEKSIEMFQEEIVEYNSQSIIDEFSEFCEQKDYDFEFGIDFINRKLKLS